jgi:pyruvate,water dikinase
MTVIKRKMKTPYLCLNDGKNIQKDDVGNKAYAINLLSTYGYNVPRSFVLKKQAFDNFMKSNNELEELVTVFFEQLNNKDFNFASLFQSIREVIISTQMPETLKDCIQEIVNDKSLFMIRSSSSIEDSSEDSFAGIFKSIEAVKPVNLETAIKEVWLSAFSKEFVDYYQSKKIKVSKFFMPVLIQDMINTDSFGVCFTLSPIEQNSILIEAVQGIGKSLVDGQVIPDTYILDRITLCITKKIVSSQCFKYSIEKGVFNKKYIKKHSAIQKITDLRIYEIAKMGMELEGLFKHPQDIEFGILNDQIFLFQSRNITTK